MNSEPGHNLYFILYVVPEVDGDIETVVPEDDDGDELIMVDVEVIMVVVVTGQGVQSQHSGTTTTP